MACIYALEFPNGKIYIGQSRQNDPEYTKLSNLKRKLWRNARAGKVG